MKHKIEERLTDIRYFIEDHLTAVLTTGTVLLVFVVGVIIYRINQTPNTPPEQMTETEQITEPHTEQQTQTALPAYDAVEHERLIKAEQERSHGQLNYLRPERQASITTLQQELNNAQSNDEIQRIYGELSNEWLAAGYELTEQEEQNILGEYIQAEGLMGDGLYYLHTLQPGPDEQPRIELLTAFKDKGYPLRLYLARFDQTSGLLYYHNLREVAPPDISETYPELFVIRNGELVNYHDTFDFNTLEELEAFYQ